MKLVNAAIYSRAYTDESVLLKDLIFTENSRLNTMAKFKLFTKIWGVSLNRFSENFWIEVNKTKDENFINFLATLKDNDLTLLSNSKLKTNGMREDRLGDQISIYYPYQEVEFIDEAYIPISNYSPITSIVTATADADEGWGSQPIYMNGMLVGYDQVIVNDDYAENNPTQIIGINGIEVYTPPLATQTAFPPTPPIDLPGLPREVKQVYIGDIVCRHQYDKFISFTGNGGGSEIRFTRSDGFLKIVDGQVQADVFLVGDGAVSRKDIKKERIVDYSREWDGDWEASNLQQHFAIYEEDNRNTSTLTGSINTTLTLGKTTTTGNIGFTINYKSDDEIIKQTKYNRDVFFILNRTDLEGMMHNGWPFRDKTGNVSFTLNDRTYY